MWETGRAPSLQTVYNKNKDQEGKFLYYSVYVLKFQLAVAYFCSLSR